MRTFEHSGPPVRAGKARKIWKSRSGYCVRDAGVAGSNPATPTNKNGPFPNPEYLTANDSANGTPRAVLFRNRNDFAIMLPIGHKPPNSKMEQQLIVAWCHEKGLIPWGGEQGGSTVKRAFLVKRPAVKKSRIVLGDEGDATKGFTKRVLLSLVVDITELRETAERLQVQVFTLAKAHGITPPK